MNKRYYFDYASSTPVDPVIAKKIHLLEDSWANMSALHWHGQRAKAIWNDSLASIADTLKIKPSEVVITSGGSESNNLAIHGVMQGDKEAQILVSAIEHQSVYIKAQQYDCGFIKVDPSGIIDLQDLEIKINDKTKMISVMQVNNEVGTIQPLQQITEIIKVVRADRLARGIKMPLFFHTDSCQATNYLSVLPNRLGVDMMTINSCKMYGPKGVGMLYVSSKIREFEPLIVGGGQQNSRRGGTQDVSGAYGLALALKKANKDIKSEEKRVSALRDKLIDRLQKEFPNILINGSGNRRIANNINVSFPGQDNETLMLQLDSKGISVANGAACSASSEEPSVVLSAMGMDKKTINSTLRITLGRQTDDEAIDYLCKSLKSIIK